MSDMHFEFAGGLAPLPADEGRAAFTSAHEPAQKSQKGWTRVCDSVHPSTCFLGRVQEQGYAAHHPWKAAYAHSSTHPPTHTTRTTRHPHCEPLAVKVRDLIARLPRIGERAVTLSEISLTLGSVISFPIRV